jgi:hypothetical protein
LPDTLALLGIGLKLTAGTKGPNGKANGSSIAHQQRWMLVERLPKEIRVRTLLWFWTDLPLVSESRAWMLKHLAVAYLDHTAHGDLFLWKAAMSVRHKHFAHVFE